MTEQNRPSASLKGLDDKFEAFKRIREQLSELRKMSNVDHQLIAKQLEELQSELDSIVFGGTYHPDVHGKQTGEELRRAFMRRWFGREEGGAHAQRNP